MARACSTHWRDLRLLVAGRSQHHLRQSESGRNEVIGFDAPQDEIEEDMVGMQHGITAQEDRLAALFALLVDVIDLRCSLGNNDEAVGAQQALLCTVEMMQKVRIADDVQVEGVGRQRWLGVNGRRTYM